MYELSPRRLLSALTRVVVLFVILSVVTFIQFRIQRLWVHYEHD